MAAYGRPDTPWCSGRRSAAHRQRLHLHPADLVAQGLRLLARSARTYRLDGTPADDHTRGIVIHDRRKTLKN